MQLQLCGIFAQINKKAKGICGLLLFTVWRGGVNGCGKPTALDGVSSLVL